MKKEGKVLAGQWAGIGCMHSRWITAAQGVILYVASRDA
jgi:hypothetical protein